MKILHISTSDIGGGAALGAYWLHKGLQEDGIESLMLVRDRFSNDPTVFRDKSIIHINGKQINLRKTINWIGHKFLKKKKEKHSLVSPEFYAPSNIAAQINSLNPDIVHLHWTQSGFVIPEDIPKINAPIVWTIRDMWAVTDGAHYCFDQNYKIPSAKAHSRLWRRKQKHLKDVNMTLVGISKWVTELLEQSPLYKNVPKHTILNGVPEDVFYPRSAEFNKQFLKKSGLPDNKKYILFPALHALRDRRKGFHHIVNIVEILKKREDICFLIIGAEKPEECILPIPEKRKYYLGHLQSKDLADYYNISDITVMPSELEAFGKVAAESIMCGTPVVCFDTGGLKDIVEHKKTGWRSPCYDTDDLAAGIEWCLQANLEIDHDVQKSKFGIKALVNNYNKLYEDTLKNQDS